MLRRLYVDNIRSLTNFELRPGQVSMLVGPNGGGKSTVFDVLQAIQMFLGPAGLPARQFFGSGTVTRWDTRSVQKVELEVEIPGQPVYDYALEIQHDTTGKSATITERLMSGGETLYRFNDSEVQLFGDNPANAPRTNFPFDPRRSFLPVLEARPDNRRIMLFKAWLGGMWLFRLRPDLIVSESKQEDETLHTNGNNFVSWYRNLQQEFPEVVAKVLDDVKSFVPGLSSIRTNRVASETKILSLDCKIGGRSFSLSLEDLSDGQRILLALYAILHAIPGRASILVFDEPDNFVTESEIHPWLSLIRDRVVESGQSSLLVISHHPSVIDYLAPDQIFRLWRDDGPTRAQELEFDRSSGLAASTFLKLGPT